MKVRDKYDKGRYQKNNKRYLYMRTIIISRPSPHDARIHNTRDMREKTRIACSTMVSKSAERGGNNRLGKLKSEKIGRGEGFQ
jgi:hypothetical protein